MGLTLRGTVIGQLEGLLLVAKAFAVCRERDLALNAIGDLLAGGMNRERVRGELEFAWLLTDPGFEKLLDGESR